MDLKNVIYQVMERTKLVRQIILCIKQLKEDANNLFSTENIIQNSSLMIEEYFFQKFTPFVEKVKTEVKNLPPDEYLAIEIDAWLRLLKSKYNALDSDEHVEQYAEVLYIKQQFYPRLIEVLYDLKLEVLESEFDARTDTSISLVNSKLELGPNTVVVSPAVVSALMSLLYNFNVLTQNQDVKNLCNAFSLITGYNPEDLLFYLSAESESGRLKAKVNAEDLKVLHKLLKSMISRTEFILSYND
ncbi:hypothetical protein CYCD_23160 [Tenuifilaceae bacterium CYCD]|nr:hypothetical protein CYCD_23160 [Tenuifilaceae bacterium CYCD]